MRLTLRNAQPKDMPTLRKLHAEQNERDGTAYPLPELFTPDGKFADGIALALAVEKDGEVLQGIYFAVGLEMCFAGCNPQATAFARREIIAVKYTLRHLGYQWIRSMIPKSIVKILEKPMKRTGFSRDDNWLASFFMEL